MATNPTIQKAWRIKGCGCDCSSMPADPCVPCDGGTYQLQCRSRSGTATLCGFSEFTNASIPPKKYLVKTLSGGFGLTFWTHACGNPPSLYLRSVWGGSCSYDPKSCVLNQGAYLEVTANNGQQEGRFPTCTIDLGLPSTDSLIRNMFHIDVTRLQRRLVRDLTCLINSGIGTELDRCDGQELLTDEDTEEDAMERSNPAWSEWGSGSCCTTKTMRTAGHFTFGFSEAEYRIRVAGAPGTLINIELTFTRSDGAPYTEIRQFVASDAKFPESPDAGWTTFRVTAGAGQSTCLASHKIYRP